MAFLTQITPPSPDREPVTLAEAKAHCRVDHDVDDAVIWGLVIAARQHIEHVTGRQLLLATWALRLDTWPCWVDVPKPPLLVDDEQDYGVTITYLDTAGNSQTLAADQYLVEAPSGPTCARGRIDPAYGVSWPSVYGAPNAITVTFTAGYGETADTVPAALKLALLQLVGHWYEHRETVIVSQFSTTAATELPVTVKALLAPFKTWPRQ